MPTFEIPDGPTEIAAPRSGDAKNPKPAEASATYTVNNRSSEAVSGSLSVKVDGPSKREWFSIDGDSERDFAPGTNTVTVRVKLPPELPEGGYPFRLIASTVRDPDNDFAEGPMTLVKLGPGEKVKPPTKWWLWILIGVVLLIALGAGIYKLFLDRPPAATAPGPQAPTDTAQAQQLAEKKTVDWVDAYNARDVEALVKLSEPPFQVGSSALLLSKAQVRGQYQDMFSPAGQPAAHKLLFDSIKSQTISDFLASFDPSGTAPRSKTLAPFWQRLKLNGDDICVIGTSHGETYLFYFRRASSDVQLAIVMGPDFPAVPRGTQPPPPPPPPAPEG